MQNITPSERSKLLLKKINTLPNLSPVVQRVSQIIADPNASAKDIVDVLRLDPTIAGRVLRLANSAYIGMPSTVSSLQNAVVILGQQRIHSLIFSSSILSTFKSDSTLPFDRIRFWKHSVIVATVCESIAKNISRYESIDTGEAFCAGILHDIGKLVLGTYEPESIAGTYATSVDTQTAFFQNESNEISHTVIGSMVAEQWNFPQSLITPILYHHTPSGTETVQKIVGIVHIADIIVHVLGLNTVPEETAPQIDEPTMTQVGLDPDYLKVVANNALKNEKDLESLISLFS